MLMSTRNTLFMTLSWKQGWQAVNSVSRFLGAALRSAACKAVPAFLVGGFLPLQVFSLF